MSIFGNPIVIIGAGPVGLTAALRLNEMGIDSIVLESEAAVAEDLRASTFHPPTLDMLDPYGITAQMVAGGRVCPSWQIRMHNTHEKAEFDLSVLEGETAHPYRLQFEQSKLCQILVQALKDAPHVEMRFSHKVKSLSQDDDTAALTVETPTGEMQISAPFVIAADGARSTVRTLLDLPFEGHTYPENTILATTDFQFQEHLPGLSNVNYVWADGGTFSLLHLPDRWRVSLYPDEDQSLEEATEPASIEAKMQRIVPRDTGYTIMEMRVYRVHMRILEQYCHGRILMAGDAAHINSPSGGMGMNGGIHDAFALTDILQRIWNGASLDLLDLYTQQRQPIAKAEILKQADRNRNRMQERDPEKRREMFAELQAITSDRAQMKEYLLNSSMITGLRKAQKVVEAAHG